MSHQILRNDVCKTSGWTRYYHTSESKGKGIWSAPWALRTCQQRPDSVPWQGAERDSARRLLKNAQIQGARKK